VQKSCDLLLYRKKINKKRKLQFAPCIAKTEIVPTIPDRNNSGKELCFLQSLVKGCRKVGRKTRRRALEQTRGLRSLHKRNRQVLYLVRPSSYIKFVRPSAYIKRIYNTIRHTRIRMHPGCTDRPLVRERPQHRHLEALGVRGRWIVGDNSIDVVHWLYLHIALTFSLLRLISSVDALIYSVVIIQCGLSWFKCR
jgi:hypothetical protein